MISCLRGSTDVLVDVRNVNFERELCDLLFKGINDE